MSYRFDRREPLGRGTRRIATELLDDGVGRLDEILAALDADETPEPTEFEKHVHEVRKRTKELRGLLRLVGPALGSEAVTGRRAVASAARELATLRDAQAVLGTLDDLADVAVADGNEVSADVRDALASVRAGQAALADAEGGLDTVAVGLRAAREALAEVRDGVDDWRVPDRFESIEGGLRRTYGQGRRALRDAVASPADETFHVWRTRAKALWYEVRLLERVAPSILAPLAEALGDLADALGDDHDLAVLAASLSACPERFGGADAAALATELARREQDELRRRAVRLGARLYAEKPAAFTRRIRAYWRAERDVGKELRTGGLDVLSEEDSGSPTSTAASTPPSTVERERKFLVAQRPDVQPGNGDALRQGYIALDGTVSVRVRRGRKGAMLTVKGGDNPVRTEVELPLSDAQFDALWVLTGTRRVEKERHRVPLGDRPGDLVAELDVFSGALDGLVVVEVEFGDDETMAAFAPPAWFGAEVTDDPRYTNAALAVGGAPESTAV
jgi:CYTH domain-containing protein/CHAD domain-containing protein